MFAALVLAVGPSAAATFKIATLSPDGTSWMKNMRNAGNEIEQRTAGRVKLRFYPGGVMGDYKAVLRKIRIGQLHGGALTAGDLTDLVPDTNIYGLPFLFRSHEEVDYVRNRIDPVIIQQLADKGMISYGFAEGGFSLIMSKQRVQTLEDAEHRKVWTPVGDPVNDAAFMALGISPITLPLTDVVTGLQTGLVDTVASPPVGAIALQWHTQVRYLLDLPLTYIYGTLVITEKALRRLSQDDRNALHDVLSATFRNMNAANRKENVEAKAALRNQGIEFLTPSKKDRAEWEQTIERAILELEQDSYFTKGMVQRVRGLVQDYRNHHP
jgi:TRAP-type C4-dicarboxylate transport system substrate-binding protein